MKLDIKINQTVEAEFELDDIIYEINELPLPQRWNTVAVILNQVEVSTEDLSDSQREIIKNYLQEKLKLFTNNGSRK